MTACSCSVLEKEGRGHQAAQEREHPRELPSRTCTVSVGTRWAGRNLTALIVRGVAKHDSMQDL
jgi:hypothetical protein